VINCAALTLRSLAIFVRLQGANGSGPWTRRFANFAPVNEEFYSREVKAMIKQFIFDEDGQGLIEYALLISLMALAVMSAILIFRNGISNSYTNIGNKMELNTSTG